MARRQPAEAQPAQPRPSSQKVPSAQGRCAAGVQAIGKVVKSAREPAPLNSRRRVIVGKASARSAARGLVVFVLSFSLTGSAFALDMHVIETPPKIPEMAVPSLWPCHR